MKGASKEFFILPCLIGTSYVAAKVTAWEVAFSEQNIIFGCLFGQPVAGKTPAMRIVTEALNKLDEINGVIQSE